MKSHTIFENITKLKTPIGFFSVTTQNEEIPFCVENNSYNSLEIRAENGDVIGTIHTETNYYIVIDTTTLRIGSTYKIRFHSDLTCKWEFCDSDEHTTCYNTFVNGWSVGIGAYDPNDEEKLDQAWDYSSRKGFLNQNIIRYPASFDEQRFSQYKVDVLKSCDGYQFTLLDRSREKIYFPVAWIKCEKYPLIEYEDALGCWLS